MVVLIAPATSTTQNSTKKNNFFCVNVNKNDKEKLFMGLKNQNWHH